MKVSIITLGCKVNQYESESIGNVLMKNKIDVSFELTDADAFVLNTCAVTNEAERKSRGIVSKIRKINQTAPVFVCGCSSQNCPEKFSKFENVLSVYGTSSKTKIANDILDFFTKKKNQQSVSNTISKTFEEMEEANGKRTRTVIKIQEGCNNFCSYCLIPYLRGRERSRDFESVKKEIENQAKNSKEITFTGINLSSYGEDLTPKRSLEDVAIFMKNFPQTRFKFSSLEQNIITEQFIKTLSEIPNFAPHFHLSLQNGADKTLKAMNRKYSSSEFLEKVKIIRKHFPLSAITTDVIVGFPTETEEDANENLAFCKKCEFAKMHIFPFSCRSGTAASHMKNITTNVKERIEKLSELDKKMHENYIRKCQNCVFDLIVEQKKDGCDFYEGHTENYIKCYIKSDKELKPNTLLKVKILKPFKDGALSKIANY